MSGVDKNNVALSIEDGGREVSIAKGDVIEIRLPENPTTGFRWDMPPADGVEIVADTYDISSNAAVGAASVRVFRLKAKAAGRVRLELKRHQQWETTGQADLEFSLDILIRCD